MSKKEQFDREVMQHQAMRGSIVNMYKNCIPKEEAMRLIDSANPRNAYEIVDSVYKEMDRRMPPSQTKWNPDREED